MKKQRGIATGWLYLIGLVALIAVTWGLIHAVTSYIDGVDAKAYKRGADEVRKEVALRDQSALQKANARIVELTVLVRAAEQEGQRKLDLIAQQSEKDRANAKVRRDRDVAAARSGTLVLRDPGTVTTCAASGDRSAGAETLAGAGVGDGGTPGQLSGPVTADLFALVDDADDLAKQLASAQAVIRQDRLTCGGG